MTFDLRILESLLHQPEGQALDFKREQYLFNKATDKDKSELLKDVLALANSWRLTTAYILIGVEEVKGGRSKIIGVQEHLDDANLHQFINSKTQRALEFSHFQFPVEGVEIGVIEIPIQQRPIFITKDFGVVKAHDVKVRDGSSTRNATPDEIAKMGAESVLSDPPRFSLEWANVDERIALPSPLVVRTLYLSPSLSDSDIPLHRADLFVNRNSNYTNELIDFVSDTTFFAPLGFRLVNNSGVPGRRIRFTGNIASAGNLELREWLDELPAPFFDIPLVSPSDYREKESAEISIRQLRDQWEVNIDFGDVRPTDIVWTESNIFWGSEVSSLFVLNGALRGDNLSDPIICTLKLNVEVEKRSMTIEDIAPYHRGF